MRAKEREAIARILIDLIKADKVIDYREMQHYDEMKRKFGITRDDEVGAYSLTLGESVEIVRNLDRAEVDELMEEFAGMTLSDGYCAREEALLMLTLRKCLSDGDGECDVLSYKVEDTWFDDSQVLYVESRYDKEINRGIKSCYREVSNEFRLCGFDFVYIPEVVSHYVTTPRQLFMEVVSLLSPSLTENGAGDLLTKIKLFKTDTFCHEQLYNKMGFKEMADTFPALMLKISQSRVGNDIYTNFLRIGIGGGTTILQMVREIVDSVISYGSGESVNVSFRSDKEGSFIYNGFYRQLFNILLMQKSQESEFEIDLARGTFSFPGAEVVMKGIHRKEKALYILFLFIAVKEGTANSEGRVISNGGISFTPPSTARQLSKFNMRMELLLRLYACIYEILGGDKEKVPDITDDRIRRPMLAGIKKQFLSLGNKVKEAERFVVVRDEDGLYRTLVNLSDVRVRRYANGATTSFEDSEIYQRLLSIYE